MYLKLFQYKRPKETTKCVKSQNSDLNTLVQVTTLESLLPCECMVQEPEASARVQCSAYAVGCSSFLSVLCQSSAHESEEENDNFCFSRIFSRAEEISRILKFFSKQQKLRIRRWKKRN